jgi:hypothetical protein
MTTNIAIITLTNIEEGGHASYYLDAAGLSYTADLPQTRDAVLGLVARYDAALAAIGHGYSPSEGAASVGRIEWADGAVAHAALDWEIFPNPETR